MSNLIGYIEKYLALGLAIIPIRPSTKIPHVKWKRFIEQAPSDDQVYEWFKAFPTCNVAALMGRVSGNVLAVDVDFRNGGETSMKDLELPETFTSRPGAAGITFFIVHKQLFRKR